MKTVSKRGELLVLHNQCDRAKKAKERLHKCHEERNKTDWGLVFHYTVMVVAIAAWGLGLIQFLMS